MARKANPNTAHRYDDSVRPGSLVDRGEASPRRRFACLTAFSARADLNVAIAAQEDALTIFEGFDFATHEHRYDRNAGHGGHRSIQNAVGPVEAGLLTTVLQVSLAIED